MAHMRVYLLVKLMNSIVLHQSTSLFTHDFLQTTSGFYLHLLSAQQLLQQQTLIFSTADLAPATVTDNSIILIDNSAQLVYKPLDCHTHPLFIASGWACGYPNGFSQILVTVLPSSISCLQLKKLGQVRSRTWANTASYLQMRLRTCKCGFFATNLEQYFFVWTCKALSESILASACLCFVFFGGVLSNTGQLYFVHAPCKIAACPFFCVKFQTQIIE